MLTHPICKINLGLNVVERRADGYHNLETVFYPVPICDALEVFEHPRLIHLGFDEERAEWMKGLNYAAARQGELWWHDFLYTVNCAERRGAA